MKRRKALCVGGAVLLFGIAAEVFIKFYPTLQLYFMAEQTGQQVITVTDPDGNEKQVLGVENYTEPTIPPEKLQKGGKGTSYSFSLETGGSLAYTINGLTFYDTIEDANLPEDELAVGESLEKIVQNSQILVGDFTVTSQGAVPDYEMNDGSMGFLVDINATETQEDPDHYRIPGEVLLYFSAHPPITETSTDYFGFSLNDGESLDFQLAWVIPNQAIEDQRAFLYVGTVDSGYTFDIFDASFQEDTP